MNSLLLSPFSGIQIIESENCRSTEDFRYEVTRVRRTWRERFVDGPVWAPKPEFFPPEYYRWVQRGIPVAYQMGPKGRPHTIVAHPEIAERMRDVLKGGE